MSDPGQFAVEGNGIQVAEATPAQPLQATPRAIRNFSKKYRDITAEFTQAASGLDIGQLVKNEFFTLYEGVSALEIGDPKMDSGYLAPGEMLEDDYDIGRDLLPDEVIGIMDQMLAFEAAWHEGYPLSRTLFTSLYIDGMLWPEPRSLAEASFRKRNDLSQEGPMLVHLVLRAYTLGLIKCCYFVRERIISQHYYEEEDFVSHTCNRELLDNFPAQSILDVLQRAIDWLKTSPSNHSDILSQEVRDALILRLHWRRSFLEAVDHEQSETQLLNVGTWDTLADQLRRIINSHDLSTDVPAAFSEKIQRRLASTVPPRPVVEVKFADATTNFGHVLQDLREVRRLLGCTFVGDLQNLVTSVWVFASRKPNPCVFSRAELQHHLLSVEGYMASKYSVREALLTFLRELVLPGSALLSSENWQTEHPNDTKYQLARKIDAFVMRAGPDFQDCIRSLCQNRCRIRRTMCHVMALFENLQLDSESIDEEIHALMDDAALTDPAVDKDALLHFALSSSACHMKMKQMEWIVQLGFEQDVYQADELAGMYWFLSTLISARIRHLSRINLFNERKLESAKRARNFVATTEAQKSVELVKILLQYATAMYWLSLSLAKIFMVLNYFGLVRKPARPFGTDELRYHLRMKPFQRLSIPSVPSYDHYLREVVHALQNEGDVSHALAEADAAAKEARREFVAYRKRSPESVRCVGVEKEWDKDLSMTIMSCVATGVAVAGLQLAIGGNDVEKSHESIEKQISIDLTDQAKRHHDWWIVPKVVQKRN